MLKAEVGPLIALIGDLDKWIAFAEKTRAANVEDASTDLHERAHGPDRRWRSC